MLKIGITGNIGSGKSTISKIFEILGVPVFYADDEAKKVMVTDAILIDGIKTTFGTKSYFHDGVLNRKYIAGIVFNNNEQLIKLNSLVHPAVFRAFNNWAAAINSVPYLLKEAALLFESDSFKLCDKTVMITAPLDIRIKRVKERDGISEEDIRNRETKQLPEENKIKLADYVINNDGDTLLIPQVLALHSIFLSIGND